MKVTRQQKTVLKKLKESVKEGKITENHLEDILMFYGLVLNASDEVEKKIKSLDLVFQFLNNGNPTFYIILEEGEVSAKTGDFQFGDIILDIVDKTLLGKILSQKTTFTKEFEKEKIVMMIPPDTKKAPISAKDVMKIMDLMFSKYFELLEQLEVK